METNELIEECKIFCDTLSIGTISKHFEGTV